MPKWSGIGTFFRFSDVITAIRIKTGRISVKYGTFIIKSRASKHGFLICTINQIVLDCRVGDRACVSGGFTIVTQIHLHISHWNSATFSRTG